MQVRSGSHPLWFVGQWVNRCNPLPTLFRTIRSFNDFAQLQENINSLTELASKWQLKFNASKCNWLHLGQHGFGEYTIGGTVIASCNIVKKLGI